jgi:pyruvate dehydrogenase E2 component (dihydrolipoamide acetyltransferase)
MPKWGMAMTEGMLVTWLKGEGEQVSAGEAIFEVETEKIINSVEAGSAGVLRRKVALAGGTFPVGALLGVMANAAVSDAEIEGFIGRFPRSDCAVAAGSSPAIELSTASIGGRVIRYLDTGAGEPGIVLIHGFGGDLNNWLFNQPALAERHRVIALDLPGHGASSKDVGAGTLQELAGIVNGLMHSVDMGNAHLVGHSLGAAIAAQLASLHPHWVLSLTLIGSVGPGTRVSRDYVEGFIAADRRKEMRPWLERLFSDPGKVDAEMVEAVLRTKRVEGVTAALRRLADAAIYAAESIQPSEFLAQIMVPMQVIWGAADRIAAPGQCSHLPGHIPIHVLDRAGHMAHMEADSAVNNLIAQHVKQHDG